ncbi:MAG: iron-sulfur cluster assembly scaffold protein [Candidatus Dojkabacteria bacterium]|jgi:NifU-like protein involved in Fe-S cluster formation|nr:iron-sulfur cluster assembly scaffold protein [Candidatus Dojkabacteria bacterium]
MTTKASEVTKQDELMRKLGYSDKGIKYYKQKLNFRELDMPSVKGEELGHCGDYMSVSLKLDESGVIREAVFEALGCAGACISGSALTVMIKGKTLKDVKDLDENDIREHLGALPHNKMECAQLAVKALKNAIEKYEENNKSANQLIS